MPIGRANCAKTWLGTGYHPARMTISSCPPWPSWPVEIWRERYRKVLEPFFEIREGFWVHNRIERELQVGLRRQGHRGGHRPGHRPGLLRPSRTPQRTGASRSDLPARTPHEIIKAHRPGIGRILCAVDSSACAGHHQTITEVMMSIERSGAVTRG